MEQLEVRLQSHKLLNSEHQTPYQVRCQDCGFFYSNTRQCFLSHIRSERHCKWRRQASADMFFCDVCDKSFTRKIDKLRHIFDGQCGSPVQQQEKAIVEKTYMDVSEAQVQGLAPTRRPPLNFVTWCSNTRLRVPQILCYQITKAAR